MEGQSISRQGDAHRASAIHASFLSGREDLKDVGDSVGRFLKWVVSWNDIMSWEDLGSGRFDDFRYSREDPDDVDEEL